MTALWPPLAQIRAELTGASSAPATEAPAIALDTPRRPPSGRDNPAATLIDLAQRRQTVHRALAGVHCAPGCVVLANHGSTQVGILLDTYDATNGRWHGWLTSAEPDWAGFDDVLLEERDGPFDPSVSVIQAWNRVSFVEGSHRAEVLARLSADRLNAVRTVWNDSLTLNHATCDEDIQPAPGRVALRETSNGQMVLTGTPLAADDLRKEYRALYSDLAQRLGEAGQAAPRRDAPASERRFSEEKSWWSRLRDLMRTDALIRPAFAMLALVVVAQQWMLWQPNDADDVRFRGAAPLGATSTALMVRWQPETRVNDAQALIHDMSAYTDIMSDGRWYIEVNDLESARARLLESGLVQSVEKSR